MIKHFFLLAILVAFLLYTCDDAFSEKTVTIPFGAYNPELNTPAKTWYDPSLVSVDVGEKVTWVNKDKEAHTITSGKGSGRFGWMSSEFGKPDGYFDSGRFMSNESWSFTFDKKGLRIESFVKTTGITGVELEALIAAGGAAITGYDMVKALQRDARITDVLLLEKTGGKKHFIASKKRT